MDIKEYDFQVFRITTAISKQVFPISLDTDSPAFHAVLDRLHRIAESVSRAKQEGGLWSLVKRGGLAAAAGLAFVRLILLPVINMICRSRFTWCPPGSDGERSGGSKSSARS